MISHIFPESIEGISKSIFLDSGLNIISNNREILIYNSKKIKYLLGIKLVRKNINLSDSKISSLGDLKTVWGNVNLRNSDILNLGNLESIGGKLNLRNTKINNLGKLRYVGHDLFLPEHLKSLDLSQIEIKGRVRFWKNNESESLNSNDNIDALNSLSLSGQYTTHIKIIENSRYQNKSPDEINEFNENYDDLKLKLLSNELVLNNYQDNHNINKLHNRLRCETIAELIDFQINLNQFASITSNHDKMFRDFNVPQYEFTQIYKILGLSDLLEKNEKFIESNYIFFSQIHMKEISSSKRKLSGKFLLSQTWNKSDLNQYIIDNINEFADFLDNYLDSFYGNKFSFYEVLYGEIKTLHDVNKELPKIRVDKRKKDFMRVLRKKANECILKNRSNYPFSKYFKALEYWKDKFDFSGRAAQYHLRYDEYKLGFGQYSGTENDVSFIFFIEDMILQTFSVIVHGLQNDFRVSRGLPKIGEGWISETDLYYKLKEHFSGTQVIHHGKPKWLGKQHVDIWFPKYKIGVEYQGAQHHQPVDFFGGKESFLKNQERDLRKKKLFEENNATLIEVLPKYVLEDVINEIEIQIKK